MRTVDPELWFKKVKGRKMDLAQPLRFGPGQSGVEARLSCSYSDAMEEFWANSSVAAYRHLACTDTGKSEKYYWRLLLVVFVSCALLVVILNVLLFAKVRSLQLSHTSSQHPLHRLQFPAVAICSYNVISNRALDILTKELMKLERSRSQTQESIRNGIIQLGWLQTTALQTPALPVQEQQIALALRYITTRYGFSIDNVTDVMFSLAPTCDSLLVKCAWRGKEMPCNFLFATRPTSVGYCCVFNSRYEPYDLKNRPRILEHAGQNNGLSVIYREDINDHALVRRPVHGAEVLIFESSEYPLLEGGAVRVQRIHLNASVFFKLSTRTQHASSSLNILTESMRGCRMKASSGPHSSYSACLLECRRLAIKDLCGCLPYTLHTSDEPVCSLDHLLCLKRHREKFLYYFPSDSSPLVLREESVNALFCPACQPDCARAVHSVTATRVPVNNPQKTLQNPFTSGVNDFVNTSVLHFFYPTHEQQLYTLEPNQAWVELIASLSSQWVCLVGLTLVTCLELVFHCTVRWRHHYLRRKMLYANSRVA